MRSLFAGVVMILFALAITVTPALAQPEMSIPFVTTPQFVYFNASHFPALIIIETNTSHLAAVDNEAFALSFPGIFSSVSPASGSTVAFSGPTIAQTSSNTIVADRTYTFRDFVST